ncbi:hypothetical protein KY289_033143 [Solanum tuberosum]|nr:hypothetical protein KY289_033143 [Solanum tuberosum]
MELLNQSNYKVWKTCMKSYHVGEDLWDAVNVNNTSLVDGLKNCSAYKKWKQINPKAEFILKRTISSDLFDHIIKCKSTHEIWKTLDRFFNEKNEARLQILENELANTTQESNALVAEKRNLKGKARDMSHSGLSGGSSSPGNKEESSNYYEIKEVDSEQGVSRAIYANSENFRESNEGDVLEVEISNQSLAITRSIVCLDQTLEANGETVDQIDGEADLQGQISAVR